ncbi:MAG: UDP-N-acetylmuramoyl-L-alanine--D-glutamate ligase [Dehalococcoidia bacterium]
MTVVGLGIEGVDLVRFLASSGARVTVSDARPREALPPALDDVLSLADRLSLGANDAAVLQDVDAVYVSQGVPWHLPALDEARGRGIEVSSMSRLFFERCPRPIAGITGSSGKTTTTALVGAMLGAARLDHVVGGNIGVGLLGLLPSIGDTTRVVVELSHTQLESLETSPRWALVTNVTPNHLDRFSWEDYVGLKRRIVEFQGADDLAIFNADDAVSQELASHARAEHRFFSLRGALPGDGVMLVPSEAGDTIVRLEGGSRLEIMPRAEIRLRGEHNVANVLAALALSWHLGVPDEDAAAAVGTFGGVPHRLEAVAHVDGVDYVNDSIATTPERTVAGLRSFDEPIVLLLGGRDKDLPTAELAAEAASKCRAVIGFGEAGAQYTDAVRAAAPGLAIEVVGSVEEAVASASRLAEAGDVVLFSPAGTSFDAYPNFERRGEAFRSAVAALDGDRSIE